MKMNDIIYEIKDWLLWIAGSAIAALIITNIASFFMGTGTPFIAVTSGSMMHDSFTPYRYVAWMEDHGFTEEQLQTFPLADGFNPGDAVIVLGAKSEDIKIGDVIIYNQENFNMPIIHRIYNIQDSNGTTYFFTKGDHNPIADPWVVSEADVEGRAWLRIPLIGSINTIFVKIVAFFQG